MHPLNQAISPSSVTLSEAKNLYRWLVPAAAQPSPQADHDKRIREKHGNSRPGIWFGGRREPKPAGSGRGRPKRPAHRGGISPAGAGPRQVFLYHGNVVGNVFPDARGNTSWAGPPPRAPSRTDARRSSPSL